MVLRTLLEVQGQEGMRPPCDSRHPFCDAAHNHTDQCWQRCIVGLFHTAAAEIDGCRSAAELAAAGIAALVGSAMFDRQ